MFWNKYPYTNFHELNLDWILNMIKDLERTMSEWEALNKITFSGEWDITKQYPAWTIVNTNGGRDGYISIRPVPAGVTIDNADYWRAVANYTDIIADLQNRMIQAEDDIDDLESDVASLESLKLLRDRRYIFVGDSYGTQPAAATGWPALTIASLGLTENVNAYRVTADSTGFIGGAGLVDPSGLDWLTLLQSASGSITNHSTITDIVVMGGTNDYTYTDAELETAIASFMAYCSSEYPNATVHVGMCSNVMITQWYDQAARILNMYQSTERTYRFCKYVNNIESALRGVDFMQNDKIHPTTNGSVQLAACLSEYLKTGFGLETAYVNPANANGYVALIPRTYFGLTSLDNDIYSRKIGNDMEMYTMNNHGITNSAISGNGTPVRLISFDNGAIFGSYIASAMGIGTIADNAGHTYPAVYYCYNRALWVSFINVNNNVPATIAAGDVFISFKITANAIFN